ncbi:response regulator [Desulfotomaculum copahuensis]|uniref:Stage 0 sporulation protein A homolog n=1 Tax=Desulfotomaculum copahuensis TaxID=1838280 RepID=A0A1B7LEC3_9FIRM|nr:response regulator transcription factor [Desulfotomaculum copahuensis]OAT81453.1 DNA-binding response regulator [Desulfotomaculum copahuensis]
MPTIMVVDDEGSILELIRFALEKEGYRVLTAEDGMQALNLLAENSPDLIILDVMLPGQDGFEICRRLRMQPATAHVPVLMLSARGDVVDRVLGLEMGADDYITKPFSPRELLARVKANLRRNDRRVVGPVKEIRHGELVIHPEKYEALLNGRKLELSPKEFEILLLLAGHPGRVFTRDTLLERIWGFDSVRETRTVDVHIRYLRQKIETDPGHPHFIETVRGVGYRFRED